MSSPLIDTLFRPTTPTPRVASAAPVRVAGTRSRAGNAMNRTRNALLAGAARAVETSGTRITMAQVAASSGVAKATLYNHFRTREAVLDALLVSQVRGLVEAQQGKALETALADAAVALSCHPVLRGLARIEPAALAALARRDDAAEGWRIARAGIEQALAEAGYGGIDLVVRWLASFVVNPAGPASVATDVTTLLAGLPAARPAAPASA